MKYAVMILAGGLSFWAIEKYAMKDQKFLGLALEQDDKGEPKLGVGYAAIGGAIVTGAVLAGWLAHKASGGRIPKGIAPAGK